MTIITPPAGDYLAQCFALIDLGSHEETEGGKNRAFQKIMLCWESHPLDEKGKIHPKEKPALTITKEYRLSISSNSTLLEDIQAWRGKNLELAEVRRINLKTLLGARCQLHVKPISSTEENGNCVSVSVSKPASKNKWPALQRSLIYFMLSDPDWEAFDTLDSGIQSRIRNLPKR